MPWLSRPLTAGLVAAAALLAACTTVGPNFHTPAAPAASGYAMAGDARPAIAELNPQTRVAGPWWRSLGSASLDSVMAQALAGNQSVAAADATLEEARAEAAKARGDRAPQASLSAGAQRERINTQIFGIPGFPSPTINLFSVGAMVSYDLDIFGGGRRRVETASAVAEAQARRADAAYLTLTGNVALQAVQIAGLRAQIAAAGDIVADDRRNIAIVRAAEAAGGEA
nr:TolC family protein [Pseudomonadota bacterium]